MWILKYSKITDGVFYNKYIASFYENVYALLRIAGAPRMALKTTTVKVMRRSSKV